MIAHVDNRITYNGNGNATEFAYQFKILDRTDIKVLLTDADGKEKLLTKDYYVDVEKNVVRYPGYAVGAEVPESERPPVLPTGWKLTIYREVPVTQETDLPDQYPFNQVEAIGDKLTMIAQQLTDVTSRSLKISVSKSADIDTTIPWENGKSFRISDDGKTLELSEDPAKVLPLVQGVYAQTQAQAQSAAASATAAAKSEDSAFESAGVAGNSAQYASLSAENAAESARLAEDYKGDTKTYMDNAKNYSENVNVFVPSVSSDGILSWTNKAGLPNPPSVNIKGRDGKDGGITVDAELNDTSTNPIQNKAVNTAINTVKNNMTQGFQTVTASIPTKVSDLENDAGYLNMGTLPSFPSTDSANTWRERQTFYEAALKEAMLVKARISKEAYQSEYTSGTTVTPTRSTMYLTATGATTLDMTTIVTDCLSSNKNSTVFTAYITSAADYTLTITNAGTIKYIGSASDVAITSAGLLLNIMMLKDASGNLTSIVQASKLS